MANFTEETRPPPPPFDSTVSDFDSSRRREVLKSHETQEITNLAALQPPSRPAASPVQYENPAFGASLPSTPGSIYGKAVEVGPRPPQAVLMNNPAFSAEAGVLHSRADSEGSAMAENPLHSAESTRAAAGNPLHSVDSIPGTQSGLCSVAVCYDHCNPDDGMAVTSPDRCLQQ